MMLIKTETGLGDFIEAISICDDLDPQDIRDMSISDFKQLREAREFLLEKPTMDFKKTFTLNGQKYGIEPELNLMSTGVFIDCEQFKRDTNANLHNLIALIYRPIISEDESGWTIEPHRSAGFEKRANLFKDHLSIEIVFGALFFFSLVSMTSLHHSLASLGKEMMDEVKMMMKEEEMILKKLTEENGK